MITGELDESNRISTLHLTGEDAEIFAHQYFRPQNYGLNRSLDEIHLKYTKNGFEVTIDHFSNLNLK